MRVQAPLAGLWFIHIFHCSLMGAGSQYVCGPGRIKPSHKSAQSVTIMYHEAHLEVQRSSIRDGLRPPSGKTEATSSIMDIDYRHDQETVIAWAVLH